MKLTSETALKIAKELTVVALQNNYIPKQVDVDSASTAVADFYLKLADKLCQDTSNERIHF